MLWETSFGHLKDKIIILRFNRFFLNITLILSIALLPSCYMIENLKVKKCPIPECKTRMQHFHEEYLFRSRITPWWKRNQDPKIGQDWKNHYDKGDEKEQYKFSKKKKKE